MEKSPATVRGRYIRQIQGKMAPVKGRRYEKLAESEDQRVNLTRGAAASFSKIPRVWVSRTVLRETGAVYRGPMRIQNTATETPSRARKRDARHRLATSSPP